MAVLKTLEVYQLCIDAINEIHSLNDKLLRDMSDLNDYAKTAVVVCRHESTFETNAKNPRSTARGLMQIVDAAHTDMCKKVLKIDKPPMDKLYEPEYGVLIGMTYLAYQYNRFGKELSRAVVAYNQGHFNTSPAGNSYLKEHNKFKTAIYKEIEENSTIVGIEPLEFPDVLYFREEWK